MVLEALVVEPVVVEKGLTSAAYFAMPETMHPHNLVNGRLYRMPSPTPLHQETVGKMFRKVGDAANRQGGQALLSPLDIEFADGLVYQPDIAYVTEGRLRIVSDRVRGAPDITVEVQSRGTRRFVLETKLPQYVAHGVREAWVVEPEARTVTVYKGDGTRWVSETTVAFGEDIPSDIVKVGACGLG